ncbi:MarR family winged helix-turn-helix transcriptional regulator [Gaetbulibacter aestuarii]|uniref:MarR family transcriptional regulator n=1 Tax=Gaetbulibacter aestuarii TaxID=1502358 RepID=A0ABW7MWG7_9FLAO
MKTPAKTVFYTIEKTIKTYRKFSTRNFLNVVDDITVDQKLILQYLDSYPKLSQKEIAEMVFKDSASITRMIDLMVNKNFLKRTINKDDRRRFKIELTTKGKTILSKLEPVIKTNREAAFSGIPEEELEQLNKTLNKILANIS